MEESILNDIKKMLGIDSSYEHFDLDIIIGINAAISTLTQLGVGPEDGYRISGPNDVWSDYLKDDKRLEFVKQYIYIQTRLVFDPPSSSYVNSSYEKILEELKWRIEVATEG